MSSARSCPFAVAGSVLAVLLGTASAVCAQNDARDAERLIKALEVKTGHTVAEVGAGGGALTVAMAREVGPTGRVYSSELGESRIASLQTAVDRASLPQVTVLAGATVATNLPDGCCDALFMRVVYHHFADPVTMNASLFSALKPGGRLAIIDFVPRGGRQAETPDDRDEGDRHGVSPETVAAELKHAGFEVLSVERGSDRDFMVVARKPS
ncbi:MAG: methyltransferase domain-containing protein [Acidobacteria bacterium]|nr:methyltransferase domain-containing protein [Acidobacteriota bacterium]